MMNQSVTESARDSLTGAMVAAQVKAMVRPTTRRRHNGEDVFDVEGEDEEGVCIVGSVFWGAEWVGRTVDDRPSWGSSRP